jgi:NAD-dependent SIR2 family protein deacetylase
MDNENIKNAKQKLNNCDALLIIAGAGMSVDSGIFTYRGTNGIWKKSIKIGNNTYRYDEISSLDMWKKNPELAWGFKANFYKMMRKNIPHEGYTKLLEYAENNLKGNYFVCTSNIDNYFERAGFDIEKIYEVHGTMKYYQCMDKKCSIRNGPIKSSEKNLPDFDEKTLIGKNLPKCPHCKNILRPNVSMFGDYDFYGKPYEFSRKKMEKWLKTINDKKNKLVILEIGCGINPHSLRMENGKMLSGEWKLPKNINPMTNIRINPEENIDNEINTIHINMGAKKGINLLTLKN